MPRRTAEEKLASLNASIEKLEKQKEEILNAQKEKNEKIRAHRLCERMGLIEKMLPDTIKLTKEQFETFIKRTTVNSYGQDILNKMIAQDGGTPAAPQGETPKRNGEKSTPMSTGTGARGNGNPAAPESADAEQGVGAVSSDKTDDTETSGA